MISFFTTAKAFSGHSAVIQRNALGSWTRLHPGCEVILLGEDGGSGEQARELGLLHVPDVARNEHGSLLVNDMFAAAERVGQHALLCYVNADIILMSDFIHAARRVQDLKTPFLLCGRRSRLDLSCELTFEPGWEAHLRREVAERGHLDEPAFADYFLFSRGLFGPIPPFAIGRRRWDKWLQYRGKMRSGLYIDATECVMAVHQNHDYGRIGFIGHKRGPETQRNIALAGRECCDMREATHKLTRRGVARAIDSTRIRWRIRLTLDEAGEQIKRLEGRLSATRWGRGARPLVDVSHAFRRWLKTGNTARARRIAVIGLGKIGLPMAVCMAYKGSRVTGVDSDVRKLEVIRSGSASSEPRVNQLLAAAGSRFALETDADRAVSKADATFLVVPTQRTDGEGFTPEHLLAVCEIVGRALAHTSSYHLVVIVSTSLPGWTGGIVQATLERASGKTAGAHFGLCYCPAIVALGNAIEGFLNPELALIGESDPVAGRKLEGMLAHTWNRPAPVVRTNFVNAELAKLALNTYVSMKISFANVLARLCEQLPGANVDVVTSALQMDRRVGRGYMQGGLSYGGPCFPADVPAFAELARRLGAPGDLARATELVNTAIARHVFDLVRQTTIRGGVVGVCGVSFKAESTALDGSPGLGLARQLLADGYRIVLYDPQLRASGSVVPAGFDHAASFDECICRSNTIVLANRSDEFARINVALLEAGGIERALIDCWRILDMTTIPLVARYHALGLGPMTRESHGAQVNI